MMPLPKGLLKSLIRQGMSAPEAMKEAWRRVRKNPGARWHGQAATEAESARLTSEQRGRVIGAHYYRGKRDAHRESQQASRQMGLNRPDYQGWTNWETWNINLWAMNEYEAYKFIQGQQPFTAAKAQAVATTLFPRGTPDMQHRGVSRRDAFERVNWKEIAEAWNENPGAKWHWREARGASGAGRGGRKSSRLYWQGRQDAHEHSARVSESLGMNPKYDYAEWEDKYRQFAVDHHLALNEKSLSIFGIKSLAHLRKLAEQDPNLNNIPLRRFDALTASYNAYNPRNRMTLSEGANVYKYLLLKMVGMANPRRSRKRYRHTRLAPKQRFDPRSFRTVRSGRALVTVGCPKGEYDPRRKRCRVGTRAQRLMRPKGNPLTRKETGSVLRAARTASRQARRGGRSPRIGTESARDYFVGRRDALVDVAYGFGSQKMKRARRIAKFGARRRTGMRLGPTGMNPPRFVGPIPGVMRRIEYRRTKDRPGLYYHNFRRGVRAYALSDGSVLLRGPKPLYVNLR